MDSVEAVELQSRVWGNVTSSVVDGDGGKLLMVTVGGAVITRRACDAIRPFVSSQIALHNPAATVLDLRKSVCAVSEEELVELARETTRRGSAIALPMGIVASEAVLPAFKRYSWEMARRGFLRGPFTMTSKAVQWTRRMAAQNPMAWLVFAGASEAVAEVCTSAWVLALRVGPVAVDQLSKLAI